MKIKKNKNMIRFLMNEFAWHEVELWFCGWKPNILIIEWSGIL
jgi:hypothetical protein